MYICICNAIREGELRKAARNCAGNAEQVYSCLGKTPDCRCCLEDAEAILSEERALSRCHAYAA